MSRRKLKKQYILNLNGDGVKKLDNRIDNNWQLNKDVKVLDLWFRDLRDRIEDIEIYLYGESKNCDGLKWDQYKQEVEYEGIERFFEEE